MVYHLDTGVLNLALGTVDGFDHEQSSTLSQNEVEGLNMAMQTGDILWKPHSTHVMALDSSVVVKISTPLDMDEISDLQYLNSLFSDIPMTQHLGTVRSGLRTHLLLSRVPGRTLEILWPARSTAHQTCIQLPLAKMLSTLRSIPPRSPPL